MRTLARRLGTTLAVSGVLLVVYAGMVVFWRDPVTSIYTAYEQHAMSGQLHDTFESWQATAKRELGVSLEPAGTHGGATENAVNSAAVLRSAKRLARQVRGRREAATPAGRSGASASRASGSRRSSSRTPTTGAASARAPGRYEEGSFPGLGQTTGIAGHRTTFAAPFRHIDSIRDRRPDRRSQMPYGTFTYRVMRHQIVDNGDWSIMQKVGYDELVLSACHPLYSAEPALRRLRPPREREARRCQPRRRIVPAPAAADARVEPVPASAQVDQLDRRAGRELAARRSGRARARRRCAARPSWCERSAPSGSAPPAHDAHRAARAARCGSWRRAVVSGSRNVAGPASAAPARRRSAGSSSSSSPTITESGLPGSPTTTRPSRSPHQVGRPGWTAMRQNSCSTPSAASAGLTWSRVPTETPPEVTTTSASLRARARAPRASPRRRRARARRSTTSAPACSQRAAIRMLFDSWICPWRSGSPGARRARRP